MITRLGCLAVCMSAAAVTACGYVVEPGPVVREYEGAVAVVKGSFALEKTFLGHQSMRGGGCLNYADPAKACASDADCGSQGYCDTFQAGVSQKVCWYQAKGPDACLRRPTASMALAPKPQSYEIRQPDIFFPAPGHASYWRVITCQPYEDGSCHKTGPDGKKLYRLAYGPVRKISYGETPLAGP